ncbi:MAG: prohibitin family protein [Prevotella sp.]|nr:prohibitin family protein [Prevotella sp.]
MNYLIVTIWILSTLGLIDLCLKGISAPDTLFVWLGVIGLVLWLYISVRTKCFINLIRFMSKLSKLFLAAFVVATMASCTERIDAGHEGIMVNLYGSDKGVDDVSLVTGRVWYNPWTTEVYEYPTFVQTIDYPVFTVNAKDGSEFRVDPTISMKIVDGKAPIIFKKYRKDLPDVINGTLYNYVKDAFRIQLNKFTTDEIVSKRDSIEIAVESQLSKELSKENFHLEQLTSGLKYPKTIVDAVNAKNKAIQEAQRALNEVKVAEAQAKKVIVAAQAEKEANELRQKSLTPLLIKQQWIEKWDGHLPKYGNMPTLFKGVD